MLWVTVALLSLPAGEQARAQYLDEGDYQPPNARYVFAGLMNTDFKARSSNPVPDQLRTGFSKLMPVIGFHQGMTNVTFGYTQFDLGGATRSSIFLGLTVANDVRISGRGESVLLLPIVLAADFTKAESRGTTIDDFNVGSLGIGTGLKYRYRSRTMEFSIHAIEAIHYSFEGYRGGSGSSALTEAEVSFLFPDVGVLDGIAFGYHLRYQTWSMSEARFDYRSVSHGPFLGVMF